MEGEEYLSSLAVKDGSELDKAWTTDEIRKNSSNWTLAGDVGLFNLLKEFSHEIISRTHEVENAVDSLVHESKMASAKINNIINDFHMLSNLQFVENRVYDEEIQEPVTEEKIVKEKTKEEMEAEMLPKIKEAIELGLSVLDKYFDKINVDELSDSEDEDISSEGHTILEPKDPYAHRPLPYIIGTEEFQNCDYAGLRDLLEEGIESSVEEASSLSEVEESSSDEEASLPEDKIRRPAERRLSQSLSASSEGSELFGSAKEEENGFISDSSFEKKTKEGKNIQRQEAEVKAVEREHQNSISSLQSKRNLIQVLPVPKVESSKKADDLFTNEDEFSDDESPFRKKTGLFTSDVKFDDEKDLFSGGLFEDSIKEEKKDVVVTKNKKPETKEASPVGGKGVKKLPQPSLFDNDEESDDDIFNTIVKAKAPSVSKEKILESEESPDKANSSSTPSSAPSIKTGNAFDFASGGGDGVLFGDDSDEDDLFISNKPLKKFDDVEDDDLFGISNKVAAKSEPVMKAEKIPDKKLSLFDESDDLPSQTLEKKIETKEPVKPLKEPDSSLFGDGDNSDLDILVIPKSTKVSEPKKNEISLFDDDTDDDIFSQNTKKETAAKLESIFAAKKPTTSLFDQSPKKDVKIDVVKQEKKKESILFDDDSEQEILQTSPDKPKTKTSLSLFEDSDSFDLFSPKSSSKDTKSASPTKGLSPLVQDKNAGASEPDGALPSKKQAVVQETAAAEEGQIGFDVPFDTTKTLNVINKDRAKITAKRRKPTRKGRLTALENSDREKSDENVAPVDKPAVPPAAPTPTHKAQEKQKMDLMSQLMSEAALSKVGKKATPVDEDEDADIFAEIVSKSKKQSFSFKSPEESIFPQEAKAEKEEPKKDEDDEVDDFFAEPSFEKFRSSISDKDPVKDFNLDDDDDDDLFSGIKSSVLPKAETKDDIYDAEEDDIFADVHKEKYEMFPSQIYDDDEDDDIFGSTAPSASSKVVSVAAKTPNTSTIKKAEAKQVDIFEDPLTGLLGE